jgi:peptidoglycan/LPS O-acetylase OafA/YrhL
MQTNPTSPYISSLTSLRGIAAWWIVIYHFREALTLMPDNPLLGVIEQGFLAVDFFFILSGFVIFINYQSYFPQLSFTSCRDFFIKRMARVYPLHFVIMIIFLINPIVITFFSQAGNLNDRYNADYYLASLLMIQNWGFFDNLAWNIPAWSISTEFGAYLVFPLLAVTIRNYFISAYWHVIAILMFCIAIFILFSEKGYPSLGSGIPNIGLIRCVIEFAMGTVIGHFYLNFGNQYKSARNWGLLSALIFTCFALLAGLPDYAYVPVTWRFENT